MCALASRTSGNGGSNMSTPDQQRGERRHGRNNKADAQNVTRRNGNSHNNITPDINTRSDKKRAAVPHSKMSRDLPWQFCMQQVVVQRGNPDAKVEATAQPKAPNSTNRVITEATTKVSAKDRARLVLFLKELASLFPRTISGSMCCNVCPVSKSIPRPPSKS